MSEKQTSMSATLPVTVQDPSSISCTHVAMEKPGPARVCISSSPWENTASSTAAHLWPPPDQPRAPFSAAIVSIHLISLRVHAHAHVYTQAYEHSDSVYSGCYAKQNKTRKSPTDQGGPTTHISHSSGGWAGQAKCWPRWESTSFSQTVSSPCVLTGRRRIKGLSGAPGIRALTPFRKLLPSCSHDLPKDQLPDTITVQLRFQHIHSE